MENIKYIVFDYSEIDKINFDEVLETSKDSVRLSVDNTKTFVKWIGDEPSFVSELQSKSIIYNNEEMIEILDSIEWLGNNSLSGTTEN